MSAPASVSMTGPTATTVPLRRRVLFLLVRAILSVSFGVVAITMPGAGVSIINLFYQSVGVLLGRRWCKRLQLVLLA